MKKLFILSGLLFAFLSTHAQIIDIPDANFKNALVNTNCCHTGETGTVLTDLDFNNDGEVQVSEALQIVVMRVDNESITSLDGIEYFTNLESLYCNDNELTSLDTSTLTNLTRLRCDNNALTSLDLSGLVNLEDLNCRDNQLTSLELSGLVNLQDLNCRNNQLSGLNITAMTNLWYLYCQDNLLTSLTIPNSTELSSVNCSNNQLTSLTVEALEFNSLDCSNNQLTSLDFSSMVSLGSLTCNDNLLTSLILGNLNINQIGCENNLLTELTVNSTTIDWLVCSNNNLTSLNINGAPNYLNLFCNNNSLTSLDFTSLTTFDFLNCSNNNLATLDLTNLESINELMVDNNQLTLINLCPITGETLSVSNNFLTEIDISNSPNLEGVFCANNLLTTFDISNNPDMINFYASNNELTSINLGNAESLWFPGDVHFDGNPDISVICTSENNFDDVQTLLTEYGYTDCTISSYCSFTPNGEYYVVQGQTKYDENSDGCDVSDSPISNLQYNITSNAIYDSFISSSNGDYTLYVEAGLHVISPILENPVYFTVSPTEITVDFPTDPSPFIQGFCITPNGTFNDLEITIIPIDAARPGFDTNYKVIYKNKGNTSLSGSVDLAFQDDAMDFVSANPANESGLPDLLSWTFSDLLPFETREITFTMNLNAPTDSPPLNDGDVLVYNATVASSETDETPDDNTFILNQTVVNSFDPNDKTCLEGVFVAFEDVGEYVHYMIRFENTGTAEAINIVVKDHIDITKYDLSSLVPLHASHDFYANIKNNTTDHYVEFIFEDINLPFDDANNDGYIAFKIKTLNTLELGDTFENNAEIYFDYNFPIITNTAETTVGVLNVEEFELANNSVLLYPNPTTHIINLKAKNAINQVIIYDVFGRNIKEIAVIGHKTNLNISTESLATGTYFVKVKTASGEVVKKMIKE